MSQRKFSILMVLHSALGIGLAVTILFLSSCFEVEPDPTSFGEESSPQSIANALNAPFSQLAPENIQKGEFVHFESNQSIAGGTKFVTKDTGITVINREDQGDSVRLTLAFEDIVYSSDGTSQSSISENSIDVPKAGATSLQAASFRAKLFRPKTDLRASESIPICSPTIHDAITYHNLVVKSSAMPVPSQVQSSPFCEDPSACEIQTSSISFDQVIWDGEDGDKIHCEFTYSSNVPYLSAQMKQCTTLAIPIEGRSVIVTECSEVLNFIFGNP